MTNRLLRLCIAVLPDWLRSCLFRIYNIVLVHQYKFQHTGRGAYVDPSAQVLGWRTVRIGRNSIISEHAWLNVNNRAAQTPQIIIGSNCYVGKRSFLSSGALISIGDYALIGADCKFLGSDHIFNNPFLPYIASGTTGTEVILVGANCWLGANVTLLGNIRVGHGSVIGAGAFLTKDVPPFSLVVGSPARIVKRYDPTSQAWVALSDLPLDLDARLPNEVDYLVQLHTTHDSVSMPLAAAGGSRGDLP